jgi:hypothetical protein
MPTQKPLKDMIPELMQYVKDHAEYLEYNNRLFLVHEGQLRPEIEKSLAQELSPKAYAKAIRRIPSINLLVRIIDKLSRVYAEPAERRTVNKIDQELLDEYQDWLDINTIMAEANKMLNLHKCCALEPYIEDGQPRLRVLPANQFLMYSDDPINPLRPTVAIKFMGKMEKNLSYTTNDGEMLHKQGPRDVEIMYLYSDEEFLIVDSEGMILDSKMSELEQDGTNPVETIPMIYINRSRHRLVPVPDTDTLDNTILIPKLLADLNYAVQFQSHSVIATTDLETPADVAWGPDVVLDLKSTGEGGKSGSVQVIKPEVDIEQVLNLIESTLSIWLESRNIKAGSIGQTTAEAASSGIAKIIDQSDATQDRAIQMQFFKKAEKDLWKLVSKMQAFWSKAKLVEDLRTFSDEFSPEVRFAEMKPIQTEKEKIETVIMHRSAGLMTRKMALKRLEPELTEVELEQRVKELNDELGPDNGTISQEPTGQVTEERDGQADTSGAGGTGS